MITRFKHCFYFGDCLFGAVKNANWDKYFYSGCGIGFYSRSFFMLPDLGSRNFIIFGVDKSSSVHTDNSKKR